MEFIVHFKYLFILMILTPLVGHAVGIYLYRIRPYKIKKKEGLE